jgi:hypothetical protein
MGVFWVAAPPCSLDQTALQSKTSILILAAMRTSNPTTGKLILAGNPAESGKQNKNRRTWRKRK